MAWTNLFVHATHQALTKQKRLSSPKSVIINRNLNIFGKFVTKINKKGEKNDHENEFYLQDFAGNICVFAPVCIVSFSILCC
ncbi:MAG: hypothetical protein KAR13_06845 [Desulfobulbaceae bacterium]|nr:hypothetical protein [Desulfobulbaceae bacterium]